MANPQSIVTVQVPAEIVQTSLYLEQHFPYDAAPNSCTERSFAALGMLTEGTFVNAIIQQRGRQLIEGSNQYSASTGNEFQITMVAKPLENIIDSIANGQGCIMLCDRPGGVIGHTMVMVKDINGTICLMDPSFCVGANGAEAIHQHLTAGGYNNIYVPCTTSAQNMNSTAATSRRIGGRKTKKNRRRKNLYNVR